MQDRQMKRLQYLVIGTLITLASATTLAMAGENGSRVLGVHDLQRVADQVRHFKPKDEFDASPHVSDLAGRHFSVIVRPRKVGPANNICKGFPSWGYYAQKRDFEVSFGDGSILVDRFMNVPFAAAFPQGESINSSFLSFASFTCKHVKEGSYRASNAFGATIDVIKEKDVVIAFSAQNKPSNSPISTTNYWSKTIAGDAARNLSEQVAVRITGVIGVWPNGQNVICGVKHGHPSLDLPYDDTLDACIFKASSLIFEVINKKTGAILYSTNAEPVSSGS